MKGRAPLVSPGPAPMEKPQCKNSILETHASPRRLRGCNHCGVRGLVGPSGAACGRTGGRRLVERHVLAIFLLVSVPCEEVRRHLGLGLLRGNVRDDTIVGEFTPVQILKRRVSPLLAA